MANKSLKLSQDLLIRIGWVFRRRDTWIALAGLIAIGLLFWFISEPLIRLLQQGDQVRTWIKGFGPWAPLAYISLFAAQILIAPLPGQFMGVMGGYVFGVLLGSLYSITGLTIGAGFAVLIGRRFGRLVLERFVEEAQWRQWERQLHMRSPVNWGLLFLFPVPDFLFYFAGLSTVPTVPLIIAVITGRGLGLLFANIMGGLSAYLRPEWVLVKWAIILVAGFLVYRNQRTIRLYILLTIRLLTRLFRRWRTPVITFQPSLEEDI